LLVELLCNESVAAERWDIAVYSVDDQTRSAALISAANIGTTNGLRLDLDGDTLTLSTTADGGDTWTPQGTPATSSLYNTSVGVNVKATSNVVLGRLVYAPN